MFLGHPKSLASLKKVTSKNAEGFLKTFSPEMKKSKSEYLKLVKF